MRILAPAVAAVSPNDVYETIFVGLTFFAALSAAIVGLVRFNEYRKSAREQARPYLEVTLVRRGSVAVVGVAVSRASMLRGCPVAI